MQTKFTLKTLFRALRLSAAVLVLLMMVEGKVWGQTSYTSTSIFTAWNDSRWNNTVDTEPYTSGYTPNNNVDFTSGNYSFAGMGAAINVGNINVSSGANVTFTANANTFATNGSVRTITVASGSVIDFSTQSFSTAAGTGFIKNGAGILALAGGVYGGGFTLNEGMVALRGVNGMGSGGVLTINGGTIAGTATRDLSGKYSGGIIIGGDFTLGSSTTPASTSANLTFNNDMNFEGSNHTITIGGTGLFTLNGIISNGSLTINNSAAGIISLGGSNAYNGTTTVSGGTLKLAHVGGNTLPASNNIVVNGGSLQISANQTFNDLTFSAGTVSIDAGIILTITGIFDCGSNVISGAGSFTLSPGATLKTANSSGINGSITVAGTKTFDDAANYEFNATGSQVTGALLPATVNSLSVSGTSDLTLSNDGLLTVSGDLGIGSNAKLTIGSTHSLTVSGTLTNNAGASGLVVNSGGSLITSSAVSATVERVIDARTPPYAGWHFISSPVVAQAFQTGFVSDPPAATEDFYLWDETTNNWINSKVGTSPDFTFNSEAFGTNFEVGKGYLAAYGSGSTKSFSGTLNVDNVPITLSYTGTSGRKGWNLIGNPFTSGITWNVSTWGATNVAGVAKIIKSADGSYQDVSADEYIPALNGFFVYTSVDNNASFTIPASAKTHNGTWYKAGEIKQFALTVKDIEGQTAQTSNIRINPEATNDFDFLYDGQFVALYAPQFYSIVGDNKLSTNSLPEISNETVINFGFVKNEGSEFKIEAEDIDGFGAIVYLTDLKTGTTQNLDTNPVYSFTATSGDQPNRFKLSFGSVGIEENPTVASGIYTYGNKIFIENPGKATLEVYNMAGQRILVQEINSPGLYQTILNNQTGYYVVRLINAGQVQVSKVFVR